MLRWEGFYQVSLPNLVMVKCSPHPHVFRTLSPFSFGPKFWSKKVHVLYTYQPVCVCPTLWLCNVNLLKYLT